MWCFFVFTPFNVSDGSLKDLAAVTLTLFDLLR